MKKSEVSYSLVVDKQSFDLCLRIKGEVLWWDDGRDGGGDWICRSTISMEQMEEVGFFEKLGTTDAIVEDLLCGGIEAIVIAKDKAEEFLKELCKKDDTLFFHPNSAELQLMFQRVPCPSCGCCIQVEADATDAYCSECEKSIELAGGI